MNIIEYRGKEYIDILSGRIYTATALDMAKLATDMMTVSILTTDDLSEYDEDEIIYTYAQVGGGIRTTQMTFYVQNIRQKSIDSLGRKTYEITAQSAIGLLSARRHMGGIYKDTPLADVVASIIGSLPYSVDDYFKTETVTGWLPIGSARDNLEQVSFYLGAKVWCAYDGTIVISAPDRGGWGGFLPEEKKLCIGTSVDFIKKPTSVVITEHTFIPGQDEQTLFEGTAQKETLVTFPEPIHSLQAAGLNVIESGANFARIAPGTGTLTGKSYIHITRDVERKLSSTAKPYMVHTGQNATLVSYKSSGQVSRRLAEYYKAEKTIGGNVFCDIRLRPGKKIKVRDPSIANMDSVEAYVESLDIPMGDREFKPFAKFVAGVNYPYTGPTKNVHELITASGSFTVPENVTQIRVVVIGPGNGGWSGNRGGDTAWGLRKSYYSKEFDEFAQGIFIGIGGPGGLAGAAGDGGRVQIADLDVKPGQIIPVTVPQFGPGGIYSPDASAPGQEPEQTQFGHISSGAGVSLPEGYTDPETGEVYALPGAAGIAGGAGAGGDGGENANYVAGASVVDAAGKTWLPGPIDPETFVENTTRMGARATLGAGGGAAAGANGAAGRWRFGRTVGDQLTSQTDLIVSNGQPRIGLAVAPIGGRGGTAIAPARVVKPGQGGTGGNGGGGAGGNGLAFGFSKLDPGTYNVEYGARTPEPPSDGPGDGSDGGDGGPGLIILDYRVPI